MFGESVCLTMCLHELSREGFFLKEDLWGGDGLAVKSTNCSPRGPEFKSQQPHGGSQPSAMGSSVMPSSGVSEDSYSVLI